GSKLGRAFLSPFVKNMITAEASVRIRGMHRNELLSQPVVPFPDERLFIVFEHACIHGMFYIQVFQAVHCEVRIIVGQLPGFIPCDDCDVSVIDEEVLDDGKVSIVVYPAVFEQSLHLYDWVESSKRQALEFTGGSLYGQVKAAFLPEDIIVVLLEQQCAPEISVIEFVR